MPVLSTAPPTAWLEGLVITDEARTLLEHLHAHFAQERQDLLAARGTADPGFRDDTRSIREDPAWRIGPIPAPLEDRRVEITGPVDRKMMINALNSGAKVFMADFEDSHSPTWQGTLQGQANIYDAVRDQLTFEDGGKRYEVGPDPATLVVRVRGLHLDEAHVRVGPDGAVHVRGANDGGPATRGVAAGLFDAALYLLHNGRAQHEAGTGPFLYIPKIESMEEAAWWDAALAAIEEQVGLPAGATKVTVLIETLPAAFQMHEILHALRDRIVGLNAGRWDYIFSCIKTLRDDPAHILPDRSQVTMTVPFMRAYTELLVATCHARGAFAMGGMSAFIPDRRDPARNEAAFDAVRQDKEREAADGFDGTWVAHPDLVEVAQAPFDAVLAGRPNQVDRQRRVDITAHDLLDFTVPDGAFTLDGLHRNVDVGIRYLTAWLGGRGAAAIHGLMEDAATAEISRSQVWQWIRHGVTLDDGQQVTRPLVEGLAASVVDGIAAEATEAGGGADDARRAGRIFTQVALADDFPAFLTLPAYERLEEP